MSRERTQPASALRLSQARQRGQVAQSGILVGAVVLAAGIATAFFSFSKMLELAKASLRASLAPSRWYDHTSALPDFGGLPWTVLRACAPIAIAALLAAIAGAWIQHGPLFAMSPDRARGGPASNAASETLVTLAVAALAGLGFTLFATGHSHDIVSLTGRPIVNAFAMGTALVRELAWITIAVFVGLGCVDWVLRRVQLRQVLRMTREEALREERDTSGNPQIKSARRQRSHA